MKNLIIVVGILLLNSTFLFSQPKNVKTFLKDFTDYKYDDFEQKTFLKSSDNGGSKKYFNMNFTVSNSLKVSELTISFVFITNFQSSLSGTQSGVSEVKVRFGYEKGKESTEDEIMTFKVKSFNITELKGFLGKHTRQDVICTLDSSTYDQLIKNFETHAGAEMRGYARVTTDGNLYTKSSDDDDIRESVTDEDEFKSDAKFLKAYRKLISK